MKFVASPACLACPPASLPAFYVSLRILFKLAMIVETDGGGDGDCNPSLLPPSPDETRRVITPIRAAISQSRSLRSLCEQQLTAQSGIRGRFGKVWRCGAAQLSAFVSGEQIFLSVYKNLVCVKGREKHASH